MSWTCPHCGVVANLQRSDMVKGESSIVIANAPLTDGIVVGWTALRCPGKNCGKFVLDVSALFGKMERFPNGSRTGEVTSAADRPVGIGYFRFEPRVGAPLSVHVPGVVKEDYEEACTIKDLSPKAAATLCRRALQGMVRDFWGVRERTLHDELKTIEPNCDPDLFNALMGIKSIGNIGAHPEKDINLIVDVEEGEVEALVQVLKILDDEWYVARAARSARLSAVHALGEVKVAARTPIGEVLLSPPAEP